MWVYVAGGSKIPHPDPTKCNFLITVLDVYTEIFSFVQKRSCYNSDFFQQIDLVFSKVTAI